MTNLQKAQGRLAELRTARDKLESTFAAASAELARLTAAAGERELAEVLQGADGSADRARIVTLDAQIQGLAKARLLLVSQIADAFRALFRAQAGEIREQARKLQGELAAHRAKAQKLMDALTECEGCSFMPVAFAAHPARGMTVAGTVTMPKSEVLAREIAALLAKADAIEKQPAPLSGSVSGETLEELIAICGNPDVLTPSRPEIESWFLGAQAAAASAWEANTWERTEYVSLHNRNPERRTQYTIVWKDGALVSEQCGWLNRIASERDRIQEAAA
jgi:hypothetical protein